MSPKWSCVFSMFKMGDNKRVKYPYEKGYNTPMEKGIESPENKENTSCIIRFVWHNNHNTVYFKKQGKNYALVLTQFSLK